MFAAENLTPCYVALLNSHTMHTERLSLPYCEEFLPCRGGFSIYTLVNCFCEMNRRRFILALNTGSGFECTVISGGIEYSVGLYGTDLFGAGWSHLLVLRPCRKR